MQKSLLYTLNHFTSSGLRNIYLTEAFSFETRWGYLQQQHVVDLKWIFQQAIGKIFCLRCQMKCSCKLGKEIASLRWKTTISWFEQKRLGKYPVKIILLRIILSDQRFSMNPRLRQMVENLYSPLSGLSDGEEEKISKHISMHWRNTLHEEASPSCDCLNSYYRLKILACISITRQSLNS